MKNNYIKIVLLWAGILAGFSNAAASDLEVSVHNVSVAYNNEEITLYVEFEEIINYGSGNSWPGVTSTSIIEDNGKPISTLIYLVDGNYGLKLKSTGLTINSKVVVDWDRIVGAVKQSFTKKRHGLWTTTHSVALKLTTRGKDTWGGVEYNIGVIERRKQAVLDARVAAKEAARRAKEKAAEDKAAEEAALEAARIEEERKALNSVKFQSFKVAVVAASTSLLKTEKLLAVAIISRLTSDIVVVEASSIETKDLAIAAIAVFQTLDIHDDDGWKLDAVAYQDWNNAIIKRADAAKDEADEIIALTQEEVEAKEAQLVADIAWNLQLKVTSAFLQAAIKAKQAASTAISGTGSLSEKLASVVLSEQANQSLLSEIQTLEGLKRDESDTTELSTFNQKYQMLISETAAFRANYLEQKSIEDENKRIEAWNNQVVKVTKAQQSVVTSNQNTSTIMSTDNTLPAKLLAIEVAEQANALLLTEILTLDSLKTTPEHTAILAEFNQKHQELSDIIKAFREAYNALLINQFTLTGYWKFPIIKGLTYKTDTHLGFTNDKGVFKCQIGETIEFLIGEMLLTTSDCGILLDIETNLPTRTTSNVSLSATSGKNFKVWPETEAVKQAIITKILFGLFGDQIKKAYEKEDENLRIIVVELTDKQKQNTAKETLDAQDLGLLVQNILETDNQPELLTDKQANTMVSAGWQAIKLDASILEKKEASSSNKKSGGGCVYNPTAKGSSAIGVVFLLVLSIYSIVRIRREGIKRA